jgi:uncharacterized coiled-coil DUF342 family protein
MSKTINVTIPTSTLEHIVQALAKQVTDLEGLREEDRSYIDFLQDKRSELEAQVRALRADNEALRNKLNELENPDDNF